MSTSDRDVGDIMASIASLFRRVQELESTQTVISQSAVLPNNAAPGTPALSSIGLSAPNSPLPAARDPDLPLRDRKPCSLEGVGQEDSPPTPTKEDTNNTNTTLLASTLRAILHIPVSNSSEHIPESASLPPRPRRSPSDGPESSDPCDIPDVHVTGGQLSKGAPRPSNSLMMSQPEAPDPSHRSVLDAPVYPTSPRRSTDLSHSPAAAGSPLPDANSSEVSAAVANAALHMAEQHAALVQRVMEDLAAKDREVAALRRMLSERAGGVALPPPAASVSPHSTHIPRNPAQNHVGFGDPFLPLSPAVPVGLGPTLPSTILGLPPGHDLAVALQALEIDAESAIAASESDFLYRLNSQQLCGKQDCGFSRPTPLGAPASPVAAVSPAAVDAVCTVAHTLQQRVEAATKAASLAREAASFATAAALADFDADEYPGPTATPLQPGIGRYTIAAFAQSLKDQLSTSNKRAGALADAVPHKNRNASPKAPAPASPPPVRAKRPLTGTPQALLTSSKVSAPRGKSTPLRVAGISRQDKAIRQEHLQQHCHVAPSSGAAAYVSSHVPPSVGRVPMRSPRGGGAAAAVLLPRPPKSALLRGEPKSPQESTPGPAFRSSYGPIGRPSVLRKAAVTKRLGRTQTSRKTADLRTGTRFGVPPDSGGSSGVEKEQRFVKSPARRSAASRQRARDEDLEHQPDYHRERVPSAHSSTPATIICDDAPQRVAPSRPQAAAVVHNAPSPSASRRSSTVSKCPSWMVEQ